MNEFNITVEGGTSKRLLTAGKYVDRDIIVTAEGGDTMVGTWILNEVLELHEFDFYFNFVLPKVSDSLQFYNLYSPGVGWLYYWDVDDNDYAPYINGAWIYPDWRTITITEEPTDPECVEWLKANARKATYEDGFAEGEKAILSTYVDWSVSTTSSICVVDFYSDTDYYAHIYCFVGDPVTGNNYFEDFVLEPYGSYSIDTEEVIGTSALSGEWSVNVTIMGFSKDGEM